MGPTETNGIEDARFVEFQDEDGSTHYYATYSCLRRQDGAAAVVGNRRLPPLQNAHAQWASRFATRASRCFRRKIDGHYAMLSRQDGENIYLMYSDMLYFWYTKDIF